AEKAGELERSAHAHPVDDMRRLPGDVLALVDDLATVRRFQPGNEVEHRRLAGPVRSDHTSDLAALDAEAGVVHGLDAAEALRDVPDLEDDVGGDCALAHMRRLLGRMLYRCSNDVSPPGMNSTTRMMMAP